VPPGPPGLAGPFARVRRRRVFSLAAACALLLAWAVLAPLSFARPELPGAAVGLAEAFASVLPAAAPADTVGRDRSVAEPLDTLPDSLTPAPGVRDPVFALLVDLVTSGSYGRLTRERLAQELSRQRLKSQLPYGTVVEIVRRPVQRGYTAEVEVVFREPLNLDVPYSILGYHPGSFTASRNCRFREWAFPRLSWVDVSGSGKDAKSRTTVLTDVHIFALQSGEIWIDIDKVVDKLLGGALDDTRVTVLALARHRGEWIGVASGYGRDHGGRSGILSLKADKILFPTPAELKGIGKGLRTKAEVLTKVWDGGEGGMGRRASFGGGEE